MFMMYTLCRSELINTKCIKNVYKMYAKCLHTKCSMFHQTFV